VKFPSYYPPVTPEREESEYLPARRGRAEAGNSRDQSSGGFGALDWPRMIHANMERIPQKGVANRRVLREESKTKPDTNDWGEHTEQTELRHRYHSVHLLIFMSPSSPSGRTERLCNLHDYECDTLPHQEGAIYAGSSGCAAGTPY
jgi:hypothetical protein